MVHGDGSPTRLPGTPPPTLAGPAPVRAVSSDGGRGYDHWVSSASALRTNAGGGVRRLGWGVADQALSSLTNFALAVLVARTVSTSSLGAFGLAFATYTITLGATRALCSEPLTVRYSATGEREWRDGASAATGVALVLGVVAGLLCIAAAFLFGGTLRPSLIVLGIGMPGLIVQDTWRNAFFCHLRGAYAFVNDLAWAVAQVVLSWPWCWPSACGRRRRSSSPGRARRTSPRCSGSSRPGSSPGRCTSAGGCTATATSRPATWSSSWLAAPRSRGRPMRSPGSQGSRPPVRCAARRSRSAPSTS